MSNTIEPRHEFYETEERMIISIFDREAPPDDVSIQFSPQSLIYAHADKNLILNPLAGEIDPAKCDYTVGKVKVEVRLSKKSPGRWSKLVGAVNTPVTKSLNATDSIPSTKRLPKKNWEGIADEEIKAEPAKTMSDDPNAGGDIAINEFFQKLYTDADDDTRRAMIKSFQESGGTTLSTNWSEVGKQKVEVKPPEGSEWKKWG